MSYRKVEDEVASGIRGKRSVGYEQGLGIIGSWCHEWGSDRREYWCKSLGRDVWRMYGPVVPNQPSLIQQKQQGTGNKAQY